MDTDYQDSLRKLWDEWGGKEGKCEPSFEYMRRKLWCDVVMTAMQSKVYDDPVKAGDIVLKEFDERFGKGEGE